MSIAIHEPVSPDDIAAQLVAVNPSGYTPQSVADSLCRLAECQRETIKELGAERDQAVKDERHLRRHVVRLLERLGQIHDGLVDGQRTNRSPADYIESLGDLLAEERGDLPPPCRLCGKPEDGPPGEEMRTGSKGDFWRTCSNVKHQR